MTKIKAFQKIISFYENKSDLDKITQFMKDGWVIVKLMPYSNYFIGVMEKSSYNSDKKLDDDHTIFIPPRKKITFSQ